MKILLWLYKSKINKHGLCPVYARITLNGEREQFSTGILVDSKKWSSEHQRVMGRSKEVVGINEQLQTIRFRLGQKHDELTRQFEEVSVNDVRTAYLNKRKHTYKLLDAYQAHNLQLQRMVGTTRRIGTWKNFESSYRTLKQFLNKSTELKDAYLNKLTQKFATDFVLFLQVEKKFANATVHKNLQRLVKVITFAVENEWIKSNPLQSFKFKLKRTEIKYLTGEELARIESKDFQIKRLANVRNYFVFQCYTGLAYSDLKELRRSQIRTGIDGKLWIFGQRLKNGSEYRLPLLPTAKEIVDEYMSESEFVFNIPSNQKMNGYLKEIADMCGITQNLSTHLARKTFCTTVTLLNGVPMETVSKMVGHSSIKTTEQSYAKVLDEKISRDMERLNESGDD